MTIVHSTQVQVYGEVRPTPIALAAESRQDSAHLLRGILADTTILYTAGRRRTRRDHARAAARMS